MDYETSKLTSNRLDRLKYAAISVVEKFKAEHSEEKLYSFTFVAPSEGHSIYCAFATEEMLTELAKGYIKNSANTFKDNLIERQRVALRWLNPDEGWYYYFFDNELNDFWLEPFTTGKLELFDRSTENICLEVLQILDQMNVFGTGSKRDSITIGFTYGCDPDDFLEFAKQVNSPVVYHRLCDEIREACAINGVKSPV
jgi:Domain of unknown function (DUF4303)